MLRPLLAPVAALLAALASAFKPLGGGGVIFVLVGSVARPKEEVMTMAVDSVGGVVV
jgi:hypothetical protein